MHEADRLAAVHRIDVRTAGRRSELSAAEYAYYRGSAAHIDPALALRDQ